MNIEVILAILTIISGIFSLLCSHIKLGQKLAGFYKEGSEHKTKQIQMLISGLLFIGFGFWWVLNPGIFIK